MVKSLPRAPIPQLERLIAEIKTTLAGYVAERIALGRQPL
jgi:hypothetical protein